MDTIVTSPAGPVNGAHPSEYVAAEKLDAPAGGLSTIIVHAMETIRRHRFVIIGAGVAGILIGLTIAQLTTPLYRASTRIEIQEKPQQVLPGAQAQPSVSILYDLTALGVLQSKSLADRVARELNLSNNPAVVDQSLPREARQTVAGAFVKHGTSVEQLHESRLVDVLFTSPDPALSARVANSLAENYRQANLDRGLEESRYLRNYLANQLETTRDRLEESERAILAFERAKDIVTIEDVTENGSPTSQSISNMQLKGVANSYADAQNKRIVAEQEYRNLANAPVSPQVAESAYDKMTELRVRESELSKTFLPDYPELAAVRAQIATLEQSIAPSQRRVSTAIAGQLRAKYEAALAVERDLARELERLKGTILQERGDSASYTILARDVDTNRELYNALLEQYKKVGAVGGASDSGVSIVDRAEPPGSPFWPNLPLNVALGLILGAGLGFIGVFLYDMLHEKITRPTDIEQRLKIKSLGAVPDVGVTGGSLTEMFDDPKSPLTEAYLNVANLLRLATKHGVPRTLLVTSSIPEEGKSSSSYGLARSFARTGRSVLLIDADLRRPTFKVEGQSDKRGLTNVLAGDVSIDEAVVHSSDGVHFLVSGGTPPNPSELFSQQGIADLIEQLTERFDVVIFDAPPILSLVDAPALAAHCEATVLVVQSDRIRVAHAQQSVASLKRAGAYVVGALLTRYNVQRDATAYDYGYGSDYNYTYGNDDPKHDAESGRRTIMARPIGAGTA
ncbi:MAG: GumC family protein [Tsuneonella sp.]